MMMMMMVVILPFLSLVWFLWYLCLVPTGSVRLFTVTQIGRVVQLEESSGHKSQKVVERTLFTILSYWKCQC